MAVSKAERAKRTELATELKSFRRAHLFTQVSLAEVLGISRREIQYLENEHVSAGYTVLGKFRTLQAKYKEGKR